MRQRRHPKLIPSQNHEDNDKNKDKYKINKTQISDGDFIKIITDDNKVDYLLFDKNE